jgi:orotidine-5'-phosphate decarboxylase
MIRTMEFADRLDALSRDKDSIAVLGVDPHLDGPRGAAIPPQYTVQRFCCEIVEACAQSVVAIKLQFAFFEARGVDGMRALKEVIGLGRRLGLMTIADAKRGDIGSTSVAYAEALLGDGDFGCDAATVNPYLGSDAVAPFLARVRAGRGVFILVKTSNPSSGELQDLEVSGRPLWESVAARVRGWGEEYVGKSGLSSVGAVVGATYPVHARRARELMPSTPILAPGYGTQGGTAYDAVSAARADGSGIVVNASRSLMYAYQQAVGKKPGEAAMQAAEAMRVALNAARKADPRGAGAG